MALGDILAQAEQKKWGWYTVSLQGLHDSYEDSTQEVEAYSEQDALDRVLISYKMRGGNIRLLSGVATIFTGRGQVFDFPTE